MEMLPNIEIIDLALYCSFPEKSALILSDIHIGYEEALNKQGVLVPRIQFEDIVRRMELIFNRLEGRPLDTIVVNGDLKHEFGTISDQEWRNTLKFIDILMEHTGNLVLIKGNHDSILAPIARKRKVEVVSSYTLRLPSSVRLINNNIPSVAGGSPLQGGSSFKSNIQSRTDGSQGQLKKSRPLLGLFSKNKNSQNILILHGDRLPTEAELEGMGTIIIGHEHPAISIRDGPRMETFKCFLKGKFKSRNLIVQPSFNALVPGTDILKETVLSPLLKQKLGSFEVYAVEDEIYYFGKVKNLKN
jgi:uncharacterized protein